MSDGTQNLSHTLKCCKSLHKMKLYLVMVINDLSKSKTLSKTNTAHSQRRNESEGRVSQRPHKTNKLRTRDPKEGARRWAGPVLMTPTKEDGVAKNVSRHQKG